MRLPALKNPLEEVDGFFKVDNYFYMLITIIRLLFEVSEARRQHVPLLVLSQNSWPSN